MSELLKGDYILNRFHKLAESLFSDQQSGQSVMVIYGGQPGAGKAVMKSIISRNFPGIVILDGDELRKEHPEYKTIVATDPDNMPHRTQQFVYDLLGALKNYALETQRSFALETTFHDGPVTEGEFREAKAKGFQTELHVLAVNPKISYLSTIVRFERGAVDGAIGRRVAKGDHFDRANKNTDALRYCVDRKVADSILLYRREVLDGLPRVRQWKINPADPVADFQEERTRDLTMEEMKCYRSMANDVLKKMDSRKARAVEIESFKKDFEGFL